MPPEDWTKYLSDPDDGGVSEPEPDDFDRPESRGSIHFDPQAAARKLRQEKNALLAELELLESQGYTSKIKFNETSDLEQLRDAVDRLKKVRAAKGGVAICKKLLVNTVSLVEWANDRYDPVGAKLHGWSNQIQAETDEGEFDDVLMRCWERYGAIFGEVNPLIELVFAVALSGAMYHITQVMVENMREQQRERQMQQRAAMNRNRPMPPPKPMGGSMSSMMGGLGGMMNGMMGGVGDDNVLSRFAPQGPPPQMRPPRSRPPSPPRPMVPVADSPPPRARVGPPSPPPVWDLPSPPPSSGPSTPKRTGSPKRRTVEL